VEKINIADTAGGLASRLVSLVRLMGVLLAASVVAPLLAGATEPDILISTTGEKFIGQLKSATAAEVTFQSQAAGAITVPWGKVKELHSALSYAVIPKNAKFSSAEEAKSIPTGAVSVSGTQIEIKPTPKAAPRAASVSDTGHIVEEKSFRHSFESPGFFGGWSPSVSVGTSLVLATQNEKAFDADVTLERVVPGVDWRNPSNRTSIDLSASYSLSHSTLPTNPFTVKTYIYQANLDRDQYLTTRLFGFGQLTLDHNYSQNLSLAQTYNGGLGLVAWKSGGQELDLKGTLGYIQRRYYLGAFDKSLFASTFGETYRNKRKHGVELHEELSFIPAWNDSPAYAAAGKGGVSVPISESFSLDINSKDSFLHGVPAGYKKNSFELSVDLSYTP
jgi:hypothetical protein